jgi:hypothetical protein
MSKTSEEIKRELTIGLSEKIALVVNEWVIERAKENRFEHAQLVAGALTSLLMAYNYFGDLFGLEKEKLDYLHVYMMQMRNKK